jgi:hypothetical protein
MTTQPSVHVRLPATLLAALRERAEAEGVSLNALISALLAGAIGFELVERKAKTRGGVVYIDPPENVITLP